MTFGKVLLAALVTASLAFASAASAAIVSAVWTCNSDGFLHVVITHDDGSTREWITKACGPSIAVGQGFNLVLGEKTQSLPGGRAFLNALETGEPIPAKQASGRGVGSARRASSGMETIQLSQADVGPHLAALLTTIAPEWRRGAPGTAKVFSIFDRWGNLITAKGEPALVPGDVGMSVPSKGEEARETRNAKQRCLDKHGLWREKPAGEWGCWTTAK